MLGYSRDEYVGLLWRDVHVDPYVADDLLAWLAAGDPGEQVRNFDARLRCKDGSTKWVRINANVLFDDDGEFVHLRGFTRDVTAGKDAEAALRTSEERLRRMIEGARDYAIHTVDPAGRVTSWNTSAQRLYGYASDEVMGTDFSVSFPEDDRAAGLPDRLIAVTADEGECRHEGWRVRKDGTRFWAEVTYGALRDPDGRLEEISLLTRDVTARRWLEELQRKSNELESANRSVLEAGERNAALLERLTEAIGGSLASIENAARRLEGASLPEADAGDLRTVLEGAANLRRALSELDPTALPAREVAHGEAVEVDFLRIAHETRDMLRDLATERRVRVEMDVDPGLGTVVGDPARVRQVLYNFLSNGIKFSRERGRVVVRVLASGDSEVRLEVEDSGTGIPADEATTIFRLRRGHGRAGERPVASGLAATKHVVEAQGGRVGVLSSPGRGSLFFAVLPRTPRTAAPQQGAAAASPARRAVLVVSADTATRASLAWTLVHAGFDAVQANCGAAGWEAAATTAFDAVAVDLFLEDVGPSDFLAKLPVPETAARPRWIIGAVGTKESGAAGLVVDGIFPLPASPHRLFAALARLGASRRAGSSLLVVDGDLSRLAETAECCRTLGHAAVTEPDADRALVYARESAPTAILLSPFPLALEVFTFLHHLRKDEATRAIPVLLTLPERMTPLEENELRGAAALASHDGVWTRQLALPR
jgi:PAS domain S-box-containing protein